MIQKLVKQNPDVDKIVAGPYIIANILKVNGKELSNNQLLKAGAVYELTLKIPVDLDANSISPLKLNLEADGAALVFFEPSFNGYSARVQVFSPVGQQLPESIKISAYSPVLWRGVLEQKEQVKKPRKRSK